MENKTTKSGLDKFLGPLTCKVMLPVGILIRIFLGGSLFNSVSFLLILFGVIDLVRKILKRRKEKISNG